MQPITILKAVSAFLPVLLCLSLFAAEGTAAAAETDARGGQCLVYVGTYTGPKSKGIYVCRMDVATGKLTPLEAAAETPSPSFLAIDPKHRFLYAANEVDHFDGKPAGAVTAFSIDAQTGKLTQLNQRSSMGSGPCHLIVDQKGRNVLVANYGSGSVAALPIQPDGRLGESTAFIQHAGKSVNPGRQDGPHAHCLALDAADRFALACDLGLDKVLVYRFDSKHGTLIANDPTSTPLKPGAGPRHIAFAPNGRHAYVINELDSTVTAFAYDTKRGALNELQTISTLPEGFKGGNYPAEIAVHPSGKFLYGSNRGHDSIAVFAIDPKKGTLTAVQHQSTLGKIPRNFAIDPGGKFLLAANQNSDNIVVFSIDANTGRLTPTGQELPVPSPVCIVFTPAPGR